MSQVNYPFAGLNRYQCISLTTFRKNGEAIATPVWFAPIGDKLYVYSDHAAGKVKRIAHTSRVTIAPCTYAGKLLGETMNASARIVQTPEERKAAKDALDRKYGLTKRVLNLLDRLRGGKDEDIAYLEISAT